MPEVILSDYFYGDESEEFIYFKIPRLLITDQKFKNVSTDAKLLYGMLLDRMGLSVKNGWYDDLGRVYIYYTLEEIQKDLNCGHDKATKLLVELDSRKQGCGLIERKKQGQGRPTKIYVKRFTTRAVPPPPPEPAPEPPPPRQRLFSGQDCGKGAAKSAEKPQSRLRGSRSQDCDFSAGNYTESNQTDFSHPDPSIYPPYPRGQPAGAGWMDRLRQQEEVRANIEYDTLCVQHSEDDVDELVELITETLCSTRSTFRIGGENIPAEQVKTRFLALNYEHINYVFESMAHNTTDIRNIRAYLITALYHAPVTMNSYYLAQVRHDWGQ